MEPTTPLPTPPDPDREHPHPIRAALTVAVLFGLGLAAAYGVSEWVDPVYERLREPYNRVVAAGPKVQALTLCNSHSRAIDFDALGLDGYHLWSPGADLYEVQILLRAVRPHLPDLDYLFVTVSPFVIDNAALGGRMEHRAEIYGATRTYRAVAGDWMAVLVALIRPILRTDNWEGVAFALVRRPQRDVTETTPSVVPTATDVQREAAPRAAHHRSLERRSLMATPDLCADARAILREIAAQAAPAHVVFYTSPLSNAYRSHNATAVGCDLDAFLASLAANTPHVTYFDDRALFDVEVGFFSDPDHLSGEGARVYSRLLAERLSLR